jgi:hypothetical protein
MNRWVVVVWLNFVSLLFAEYEGIYEYSISNGEVTVSYNWEYGFGQNWQMPSEISIPSEINGFPVRHIGIFGYNSQVTNIVVPTGAVSISDHAFRDTPNLRNVEIPNTITSIGKFAFKNSGITSVILPDNLTHLSEGAFENCGSLTNIYIGAGVLRIEREAFYGCSNLPSVVIPEGVTNIGVNSFRKMDRLKSIIIPNSVVEIEGSAFVELQGLTNVVFGLGITNIGSQAFAFSQNIGSISLPSSLKSIQYGAFQGIVNLTNLIISNGLVEIAPWAFADCPKIPSIVLPISLERIGNNAFQGCTGITNLSIPPQFMADSSLLGFGGPLAANNLVLSLANTLATNTTFINNLAQAILAASNNYGLATKTEVGGAVTMGVQQVLSAPSDYNLFTTQQVQSERTAGQNDVLSAPNSFSLYTTNQIHNLGLGGIMLNRNTSNQLILNYQILQSSDLQSWSPYQQTELVISNAPADKLFLRVQVVENNPYLAQSYIGPSEPPPADPLPGPAPSPNPPSGSEPENPGPRER